MQRPYHAKTILSSLVLLTILTSPGCAHVPQQHIAVATPGTDVVFSVDGSACLHGMAPDLSRAARARCPSLRVEAFHWSHGPCRVFADLHGQGRHRAKGKELASAILAQRQICPMGKIYLVCHSSGAAVGLAAVECLPPGSIDRIILLAPALSPRHDLRCALRRSCEGIDVFTSRRDVIGRVLALVGNADGSYVVSAACVGFTTISPDPCDVKLYAKLRQHHWQSCMTGSGHCGGHFGCTRIEFFRTYVVPLLVHNEPRP